METPKGSSVNPADSANALVVWQQDDGAYTNIQSSRFQ